MVWNGCKKVINFGAVRNSMLYCCVLFLMEKKLNDQYWSERYQSNQIGWDIGQASTPIATYIDQIEDKSIKILIPGCGNAHELGIYSI